MRNKKIVLGIFILLTLLCWSVNAFADRVQDRPRHYPYNPYNPHDRFATMDIAREIMPRGQFYGQREIEDIIGYRFTRQEKRRIYNLPFKESTLERCRDCVLFLTVPSYRRSETIEERTSINSLIRYRYFGLQFGDSRRRPWFKKQRFAKRSLKLEWRLIRVTVEDKGRKLIEMVRYLTARERIAPANVYVYLMLIAPHLFIDEYVITSDHAYRDKRAVIVGRDRQMRKIRIKTVLPVFEIKPNMGMAVEIKPDRGSRF